jgi:hypothetical protein
MARLAPPPILPPTRPALHVRLSGPEANHAAGVLERAGWRAEAVSVGQGVALVEVRAVHVRGMPLVATLRHTGDLDAFLAIWPGRRPPGPRLSPAQWRHALRCVARVAGGAA